MKNDMTYEAVASKIAAYVWKSMSYWFWESSIPDLSIHLSQSHNLKLLPTSPSSNAISRPESRTQHTPCPLAQTFYSRALTNLILCSLALLGPKKLASFLHRGGGSFCRMGLEKLNVYTISWGAFLGNETSHASQAERGIYHLMVKWSNC